MTLDRAKLPTMRAQQVHEWLQEHIGAEAPRMRTITDAIRRRELVPHRIGHRNLFSEEEVLRWIESTRRTDVGIEIGQPAKVANQ